MARIKKMGMLKRRLLILRLIIMPQGKRAPYLKKARIFFGFGDGCKWGSSSIPSEPYLVSIGNNVRVAKNVTFITHDIISGMFDNDPQLKGKHSFYMGTIEVRDNVAIGSNSTILYNTKIGPNAIIAAGSVVTKDVPEGVVVGGNPARIIGSYYELADKRAVYDKPSNAEPINQIIDAFWNEKDEDSVCNR